MAHRRNGPCPHLGVTLPACRTRDNKFLFSPPLTLQCSVKAALGLEYTDLIILPLAFCPHSGWALEAETLENMSVYRILFNHNRWHGFILLCFSLDESKFNKSALKIPSMSPSLRLHFSPLAMVVMRPPAS